MIELREIRGSELIPFYSWIKELNYTDITAETCLAKCLLDEYKSFIGLEDDRPAGIVIYKYVNPTFVFVVGLWGKNKVNIFRDMFFNRLKQLGVKTVRASTTRPEKSYGRVMKMKRLWAVYERVL